jgi:signal transduction histidine kinase
MPKKLKSSTGLGLAIMRYRATMIDAEFRLISAPGRGTKVSCALPGWPDMQVRGTP